MVYSLLRFLIRLLLPVFARIEAQGLELLPRSGGYICVANHLGRLDVPLVYHLLQRDDIILLVAEKYQKIGLVRWLVRHLDAIWVERFNADLAALRHTLARLREGGVLVIAPEGTRSQTGGLIPGRQGAAYLAARSGVLVVPVGVTGTEDQHALAAYRSLRRPSVRVRVGQPFQIAPLARADRAQALQEATDEIMCRIGVLLPPEYRGVYRDHPRLQMLLGETSSAA